MAEASTSDEQNTEIGEFIYSRDGGKALKPPPGIEPGPLDFSSVRNALPTELPRKGEIIGNYHIETHMFLGKGAFRIVSPATDSKGNKVAAKRINLTDKCKAKISKDLEKL